MLSDLFPKAYRHYASLPLLGSLVEAYETWSQEQGYPPGTRRDQLHAIVRIDRYLRRRGLRRRSDLTRGDLDACWRCYRRRAPHVASSSRILQRFLETRGLLPPRAPAPPSRIGACVLPYGAYLCDLRGLTPATIQQHVRTATEFLAHLGYEAHPARLAAATPGDIEAFVRWAGGRLSRATLQHTVAALRSFLRFLASGGAVRPGLDTQIDTPRCYRHEQLPRSLPWDTVRAFLASIDRTTPLGLRDYTMMFLIATYGLRTSEVVALTLDAIDWRADVLHIPPRKQGPPRCLPLTDAAGTVLLDYLRHGRPSSPHRALFLRARAPAGVLQRTAATDAFQAWARRSGLAIPFQGPHCLRHSYAVHLLRRGVALKALGDLLGHRTAESTCVYLRLALDDLRGVPLAVPRDLEVAS